MSKKNIAYIVISVLVTIAFILLAALVFKTSYIRIFESLTDLIHSIKYYFCKLFGIDAELNPSILDSSNAIKCESILPSDFDDFKVKFVEFWRLFANLDNFILYGKTVSEKLGVAAQILVIILPFVFVFFFVIKKLYSTPNTKHNKDTKPLQIHKTLSRKITRPTKQFIIGYFAFLNCQKWIPIVWAIIWFCSLNLTSIVISFFAYFLYFSVSFDFVSIYTIARKLIIDLQVIFKHFPWWSLLPVAWLIFEYIRRKIAVDILRHKEAQNCGFINALPIVSMTCGSMGKRKTTIITDMALSQDVMFRQKALELLQKNDMRFPSFPWIALEMEVRKCMEHHVIYNLASIEKWMKLKRERFEKHHNAKWQLYGYDYDLYGLTYNDELKTYHLFDVLTNYVKLYFIYVIESSLIVSNYSVREDSVLMDGGNFPIWSSDFFIMRDKMNSHNAHILDFDTLRLGRKVIADNINNGSFEFGVVLITEVGKERGNNLELKEVKKGTLETNQKNDLFNNWLKMCRHSATVENFPFIKVFTDEQRPESWGADARDLADIVTIISTGETHVALPFYTLEEMIAEKAFKWFIKLYYDFRYKRGDNTLFMHTLKWLVNLLYQRNLKIYNKYGYSTVFVQTEQGTMDGKKHRERYNLMNYKIYKERFSTDCFSDYFSDMAIKAKVGLNDYITYTTEKASVEELKRQHSYFIDALYRDRG